MMLLAWLAEQTIAVPAPVDWLARAVDVAQILLVPIGGTALLFVWDIWKKVSAMWTVLFGRPEIKEDDGLVGSVRDIKTTVELIDRDVERLCEHAEIPRTESRT